MQEPRTVSGKPMTATIAFRVPIPDYQRALTLAERRGTRLSELMRDVLYRELEKEHQRERGRG